MVIGVVVGSFYSALTQGLNLMRMDAEDARATQILVQKAETIRLYSWEQINSNGFIPASFAVTQYPSSPEVAVVYTGAVTIASAPLSAAYTNNVKLVTVTLSWNTGEVRHQRELRTLIARYGLQSYVD
jgi:hypothetical protein